MFTLVKLYYIIFYRWLLSKYSNHLVRQHWNNTPFKSTEDNLAEIKLQNIRYKQRNVEQKRWQLYLKIREIGFKSGIKEDDAIGKI